MRITVISDSHRRPDTVRKILEQREDSQHVFFLGDVVPDIEDCCHCFPDKQFFVVSGNCDVFSLYPTSGIEHIAGQKVFYTHGHTFGVKHGIDRLLHHAKTAGCSIVLFGHTHVSQIVYENGVTLVNPGSCAQPREGGASYAVIDITQQGIMPILIKV